MQGGESSVRIIMFQIFGNKVEKMLSSGYSDPADL